MNWFSLFMVWLNVCPPSLNAITRADRPPDLIGGGRENGGAFETRQTWRYVNCSWDRLVNSGFSVAVSLGTLAALARFPPGKSSASQPIADETAPDSDTLGNLCPTTVVLA